MGTDRPRPLFLAVASGAVVLLATAACLADRPTPVEPADEPGASQYTSVQPAGERVPLARQETEPAEASTLSADEGTRHTYERVELIGVIEASEGHIEDDAMDYEVISVEPVARPEPEIIVLSPSSIGSDPPAPLMVVDGVILRATSMDQARIAPSDIISIEVTRGETARSLYGPRAAGGVINISTRAGEEWRARNPPPAPPGGN